jgi:hypothetical protein
MIAAPGPEKRLHPSVGDDSLDASAHVRIDLELPANAARASQRVKDGVEAAQVDEP